MPWTESPVHSTNKAREFESLAFPLMDQIFGTALKLTRDKLDAEDLTQNAYYKAWKNFDRFKRGSNFRAWFLTIMTNTYINQFNREKRSPFIDDFETGTRVTPAKPENEGTLPDLNKVLDNYADFLDDSLTQAIDRLPEAYKMTVLLSDLCELKYEEISRAMNCPIGTVMSRLSRGRGQLAKELKNYAVEHGFISSEAASK